MTLRSTIKRFIPPALVDRWRGAKDELFATRQISAWEAGGRPLPPPRAVKQRVIRDLQSRSKCRVFVETGTYNGDMVFAQRRSFSRIYSIELSDALHAKAVKRFRGFPHIRLLKGDSGVVLNDVLRELDEPAISWLDGHYSGGETALGAKHSPISEELNAISAHGTHAHVVLVDDANLFNGENGYPTADEVRDLVSRQMPGYSLRVDANIIAIVPDGV